MIKYILLFLALFISKNVIAQTDTVSVTIDGLEFTQIVVIIERGETVYQALKREYINNGYFDVVISPISPDSFKISNDHLYVVNDVEVLIDGIRTNASSKLTSVNFYNKRQIEDLLEEEYYRYIDLGYLNAEVELTSLEVDSVNGLVDLTVNVRREELVTISTIVFSGNRINSDEYLTKVSRMKDSLVASKNNLLTIKQNLLSSELFEEVLDPEVFEQEGQKILFVSVNERALNNLEGLIGYVPNASGKGQIVGDLDVSLWNVLRDGNSFELLYQRLKPETSRIRLSSSQDWIFNVPLKLGVDFSLYQNDSTYQTRNIGLSGGYWTSSNLKLDGRVYSMNSNSRVESGIQKEPDGSKQGSELGFTYSALDRVDVPNKGLKISIIYGLANKDIENDSSAAFRQQRLETSINTYFRVFDNAVIATRLNAFYVIGDEFTESDLIRFGGANSFRGYAEEQFTASELLWGDIEYRFLTDRSSYLFLFTAAGIYDRPRLYSETDNSFVQNDFLYSGGFGLSYKTAIGRLKFSYALSSTETLGNGKVHFGISTSL
jgi:outer membrane protein assembly factor BamA